MGCEFREYLKKYEPTSQILEPKPLYVSTTDDSPLSHRFITERFANNMAPRQQINIPSVLCSTLKTKLNSYKDDETNRNCHIYRHILETPMITKQDIETAQNDLLSFTKWLEENKDDHLKILKNNKELNEIKNKMQEHRNKLSSLESKLTLSAEIERAKLNALNQELTSSQNENTQNAENENEKNQNEQQIEKENEAKARKIRNIQFENQIKSSLKNENISTYFENEPFLRDFEINQNLLEIFCDFIKKWKEGKECRDNEESLFVDTLSSLKNLCKRLREIISVKELKGNLKVLSLNEDIMINIMKNEFIVNHIDNLLHCV